jgi:hypothetical protein
MAPKPSAAADYGLRGRAARWLGACSCRLLLTSPPNAAVTLRRPGLLSRLLSRFNFPAAQEPLTAIAHLFGGSLQSRVRCGGCGATSDTVDPFLDLSLELLGCTTLLAALRKFTAPEPLTGANAYKCDRCRR